MVQVQPLISVVAKRMKLSSNIAKRKIDQDEPDGPCEEDWGHKIYSSSSNVVYYDEYGKTKVATFDQLSSSLVNHGLFTGSSAIPSAKLSNLENISLSVETFAIDEGQESIRAF